ncbi:MAG: tetratricopeptide repeat protein [Candidatus Binataceae bacterium]
MPATVRRPKIKRKDLRAPDEFSTFVDRAAEFVEGNSKQIIAASAAAIALAVMVFVLVRVDRGRARAAAAKFSGAVAALSGGDYQRAAVQFKTLAASDSSRRLGQLAGLYLGSAYLESANQPDAPKGQRTADLQKASAALNAFVAGEHDPLFIGMARMNLAVAYEQMGDWSRAADAYGEAASTPGPQQMRAQMGVARMLAKAGKKAAAISAYREFIAAHPYATQREEAMESLALMGVAPQAESPASAISGKPASSAKPKAGTAPLAP